MTTLQDKLDNVTSQYSPGFLELMAFTLPHECVFARHHQDDYDFVVTENVPGDPGGPTKYGIDQNSHAHVEIENLTFEDALAIYFSGIWKSCRGALLHPNVAISLCDAAINCGNERAIKWMQEAAGFTGDDVDGIFGPDTLRQVQSSDPRDIANGINTLRDHYYTIEVRESLREHFLAGWENRLHDLETYETTLPVDVTSQDQAA